jgi:hypothetical protein
MSKVVKKGRKKSTQNLKKAGKSCLASAGFHRLRRECMHARNVSILTFLFNQIGLIRAYSLLLNVTSLIVTRD